MLTSSTLLFLVEFKLQRSFGVCNGQTLKTMCMRNLFFLLQIKRHLGSPELKCKAMCTQYPQEGNCDRFQTCNSGTTHTLNKQKSIVFGRVKGHLGVTRHKTFVSLMHIRLNKKPRLTSNLACGLVVPYIECKTLLLFSGFQKLLGVTRGQISASMHINSR